MPISFVLRNGQRANLGEYLRSPCSSSEDPSYDACGILIIVGSSVTRHSISVRPVSTDSSLVYQYYRPEWGMKSQRVSVLKKRDVHGSTLLLPDIH